MPLKPRIGAKRKARGNYRRLLAAVCLLLCGPSFAALTPEEETRKLAQYLKPISNEMWAQIAGERASQQYQIVNGDTLYDISKRLFGDPKYWPKIWALNNGKIINPHLILPGKTVAFMSGSGTSLPSVGLQANGKDVDTTTATDSDAGGLYGKDRSQEWRDLPPQPWEDVTTKMPPNIDPQGFDKNNKIHFSEETGFDLKTFQTMSEIPYLGEITGARQEATNLILGDVIYVKSLLELQVGETYTITNPPIRIQGAKTGRKAYSYLNLGKIKIIGVRDGIFVGNVVASYHPMTRGQYLIPMFPRVKEPEMIAGPTPVEGTVVSDGRVSTGNSAQFTMVYVDRGTDDGVQPGMIFRSYQHVDPNTHKVITQSDFIIQSDFMVVRCTEKFSEAVMINGVGLVVDKSPVVLLTDIHDMLMHHEVEEDTGANHDIDKELDELDRLDPGGDMGTQERRELKQLEKWKQEEHNPEGTGPNLPTPPAPEEGAPEGAPPEAAPQESAPPEEAPGEPPPEGAPDNVPPEGGPQAAPNQDQVPTAPVESAPVDQAPPEGPPAEGAPPPDAPPSEAPPPDAPPPEAPPAEGAPGEGAPQPAIEEPPAAPDDLPRRGPPGIPTPGSANLPDEPPPPPEVNQ